MRIRSLLLATLAISLGLAAGVTGQSMIDGVRVDLPYPVKIGDDVVLEPGEYEIRRASQNQDQVLRIFSNDKMRYETHVITIPVLENDTPEDTKVVLHHIGDDYYFDKIWIEGKDYGYEFVLPERARALKRELAELPAQYMPTAQTTDRAANQPAVSPASPAALPESSVSTPGQPTQSQSSTAAVQSEVTIQQNTQAELDRQAQAERDRQAELAAQREPDPNVDTRIAQLENQAGQDLNAAGQTAARTNTPEQQADFSSDTERLPATSANWLGWILGGAALITLSAAIRAKVSE